VEGCLSFPPQKLVIFGQDTNHIAGRERHLLCNDGLKACTIINCKIVTSPNAMFGNKVIGGTKSNPAARLKAVHPSEVTVCS
jgi:hypothetical protein